MQPSTQAPAAAQIAESLGCLVQHFYFDESSPLPLPTRLGKRAKPGQYTLKGACQAERINYEAAKAARLARGWKPGRGALA